MSGWIEADSKMPPYGKSVIVVSRSLVVQDLTYFIFIDDDERRWQDSGEDHDPVDFCEFPYWHPLPEPPKHGE